MARVVLGLDRPELAEEVVDFLDRSGKVRVVATASDPSALARAVHEERPDAVVAQPSLVENGSVDGAAYLAVATAESVGTLRRALQTGAGGFYLWPSERAELAVAAGATAAIDGPARRDAPVVALLGARGGVGVTFLTAHLAAALARGGRDVVVLEGDPVLAGLSALEPPVQADLRTIADVAGLEDDLGSEELSAALWSHPFGFRVLLGPTPATGAVPTAVVGHAVRAARGLADVVVVATPPGLGPDVRQQLSWCSRVGVVTTLDLPSVRGLRRVLDALGDQVQADVVVNMGRRSELVTADVERIAARPVTTVVPFDRAAAREWARGRLATRGPAARATAALAGALVPASVAGAGEAGGVHGGA